MNARLRMIGLLLHGAQVFNSLKIINLSRNFIGSQGTKALAKALEPKQQPDGTWVSVFVVFLQKTTVCMNPNAEHC